MTSLPHQRDGIPTTKTSKRKDSTLLLERDQNSDLFQKEDTVMEAVYYAARANLRRLMILHPTWTRAQLAQATGMSKSWVDKWKKRLVSVPFDDEQVLQGLPRAPHHALPRLDPQVVDRVLEIRDDPPEGLGRTPGPKAILYYLRRDEALKEGGLRRPQSTRTIHRILRENGRIASRLPTEIGRAHV